MNDDLLICRENEIGFVVLNRPKLLNAVSRTMWEELPGAVNKLQDNKVKVIVITGEGSSFASGADLAELEAINNLAEARSYWHTIRDALNSLFGCNLPTIAMIDGPCLGGGCLIALACDLRYASDKATFALPVARLGILLDDENIARLVGAVGPAAAKDFLFRANTITAWQAKEIGLINEISEGSQLRHLVLKAAHEISNAVSESVLFAKQSVNRYCQCLTNNRMQYDELIAQSYLNLKMNRKPKLNQS